MLNTHLLTGRERAKAVADYGFLGWAKLKQLVDPQCCERLLGQAELVKFDPIFNQETKCKSKKPNPHARAAAKAGQDADDVLRSIHNLLNEMLIISDTHPWGLGRGATFLKTPPGCLEQVPFTQRRVLLAYAHLRCPFLTPAQVPHRDYYPFRTMTNSVSAGRRHRPCSVLIALQNHSGLKLYNDKGMGFVVELSQGDVLIFAGDTPHNGLQSRSELVNVRLFGYFPTIWSEVPWSTEGCKETGISVGKYELLLRKTDSDSEQKPKRQKVAKDADMLPDRNTMLDLTDPQLETFKMSEYSNTLYDRADSKFYHFSDELWYTGIDTAKVRPTSCVSVGCCSRYLSSIPVVARYPYKHCEHFSQEDFCFGLDRNSLDKEHRKACQTLLSKYRKDCAYCVPCKAELEDEL
jgi:hypothetical protein